MIFGEGDLTLASSGTSIIPTTLNPFKVTILEEANKFPRMLIQGSSFNANSLSSLRTLEVYYKSEVTSWNTTLHIESIDIKPGLIFGVLSSLTNLGSLSSAYLGSSLKSSIASLGLGLKLTSIEDSTGEFFRLLETPEQAFKRLALGANERSFVAVKSNEIKWFSIKDIENAEVWNLTSDYRVVVRLHKSSGGSSFRTENIYSEQPFINLTENSNYRKTFITNMNYEQELTYTLEVHSNYEVDRNVGDHVDISSTFDLPASRYAVIQKSTILTGSQSNVDFVLGVSDASL